MNKYDNSLTQFLFRKKYSIYVLRIHGYTTNLCVGYWSQWKLSEMEMEMLRAFVPVNLSNIYDGVISQK